MSDIPLETIIQREKWRRAKAKWRSNRKEVDVERKEGERRHPQSKLTLDEELPVFGDYLRGDSYRVLCKRYSLSKDTINRILSYWKELYEDRFSSAPAEDIEVELVEESKGGFF